MHMGASPRLLRAPSDVRFWCLFISKPANQAHRAPQIPSRSLLHRGFLIAAGPTQQRRKIPSRMSRFRTHADLIGQQDRATIPLLGVIDLTVTTSLAEATQGPHQESLNGPESVLAC